MMIDRIHTRRIAGERGNWKQRRLNNMFVAEQRKYIDALLWQQTRIKNLAEHLEGHSGHLLQSAFNINKQLDAAAPYNHIAWELRQLLIEDD